MENTISIILIITLRILGVNNYKIDESNNCFFEDYGIRYINPSIIKIERTLDFAFLEESKSNLKDTLKLIKASCEERSSKYIRFPRTSTTDTYDVRTSKEEVKRTCTANFSLPLPIFKTEREELLSQMRRYEEDFVLANVKYVNGSYVTHSNTPIPLLVMDNIMECDNKYLQEGKPFFYTIRQAALEGPCQLEKEVDIVPVICQKDISKRPGLRSSCIFRINNILTYINDVATAITTVHDKNEVRSKKSISLAIFAITGIISLLAFDIVNTVSHQRIYRKSEDAERNSNKTFNIAEDIFSLWRNKEWVQRFNERAKIIDEEITFLAETTNYYEYATNIYSRTEMKMRSSITDINECAKNNHISMFSITKEERTALTKKTTSIQGKFPEHEGLCSTIYDNKITLQFRFPIKDKNKQAKLLKITCIPKFEYYGKVQPISYPQHVAIQTDDSGYYELSDIHFEKCIDSNICQGAYPKFTKLNGCGIGNYIRREDSCDYEPSDDGDSPFIFYAGQDVFSYAAIGTKLFENCGNSEKKRTSTTMIKTHLKRNCTYEIGEYLQYDPANTYDVQLEGTSMQKFPFQKHQESFYLPPPSKYTSKNITWKFTMDTKTITIVVLSTALTLLTLTYHLKLRVRTSKTHI